ncbi:MAG TPA: FG-GAP-like repeat-containing protein, partial [Nitrospiria bacterium]
LGALLTGDLNLDSRPDLIALTSEDSPGDSPRAVPLISHFREKNLLQIRKPFDLTPGSTRVVTGDFNRDGKPDLISASPKNGLRGYLGDGSGDFTRDPVFPLEAQPDLPLDHIFAADFNGDSYPDLALLYQDSGRISLLINNPEKPIKTTRAADARLRDVPLDIQKIVHHPDNPQTLLLGTRGQGIYKSTDGGASWTFSGKGLRNGFITELLFHPEKPRTVFAGTWGGGIFISRNGGRSWKPSNAGLTHTAVNGFQFHPSDSNTLFLSTTIRFFKSIDGGRSWEMLDDGGTLPPFQERFLIPPFLVLPGEPLTLHMGTPHGLLSWTESNGKLMLERRSLTAQRVRTLWFDDEASRLFAGTDKGERFISSDLAKTWETWDTDGTKIYPFEILGSKSTPGLFFVRDFSAGLLRTTDGGKQWEKTPLNIKPEKISSLGMSEKKPAEVFVGTQQEGLFKSTDFGKTWENIQSITLKNDHDLKKEITAGKPFHKNIPPPPKAFAKCNQCHGWIDPNLRFFRENLWQIYPTPRDWTLTVSRMGQRADLFDEERAQIIDYMNRYYGPE